ncbi:MAG TPA: aldo/keto reductase [Terriglobales bacterium]|nr:aldo/keto reductase [Terriglobales bacterium]
MTSVALPQFIYGTAWKEERTAALTELALRAGFRAIDTANQRRHYFEAAVGEALQAACASGIVQREELFLQTKFTYRGGQDHRLPYDPAASIGEQVRQSLQSSLEHLRTTYLDSFVLHGPASGFGWTATDTEAWAAMRRARDAGRARALGVSNVSSHHLEQMLARESEPPQFVQNRCFARSGWDRDVRELCRDHGIAYQGFSLLTANSEVAHHRVIAALVEKLGASAAQIVFAFARGIGIVPLTGTSSLDHMKQDLASLGLELPQAAIVELERAFG